MTALRPDKRKARRPKVAVYDLEWIPHTLEIRVAGFYDGSIYVAHDTIDALLNQILSPKYSGFWIYAHAGGLYDVQFLFERLIERTEYQIDAKFAGASAIIVKVKRGKHTWTLLDSFWLLKAPLRKIAKMMGRDKGGIEELPDGSNRETVIAYFRDTPIQQLREYNYGDCKNLYDAIIEFQERLESLGGELSMTLASCAMTLFRRQFLTHEIPIIDSVNRVARSAYIASRVEVFSRRCDAALDYDINSSFPAAMLQRQPGSYKGHYAKLLPKKNDALYLARCEVHVPDMRLPPLPYRDAERRIFFPVGTWHGWFYSCDLELLQEYGGQINAVYESVEFDPTDDLAGYAEQLYAWRKSANDEALKYILKILLNSLYGKFAERSEKQSLYIRPDTIPANSVMIKPGVYLCKELKEVKHAHVPFACSITSIARARLYRYMAPCNDVHYCDTDGFLCDPASRFKVSNELGELKLEATVKSGVFLAPKLYSLETAESDFSDVTRIVKAKGFRKLSYGEFCELAEDRIVQIERFSRIRENLRRNGSFKPGELIVPKTVRHTVRPKRKFEADGTSVPWNVNEIET